MTRLPVQVDSFSREVEVRAVVEGQFLSRRLYAENLGCRLGECLAYHASHLLVVFVCTSVLCHRSSCALPCVDRQLCPADQRTPINQTPYH